MIYIVLMLAGVMTTGAVIVGGVVLVMGNIL